VAAAGCSSATPETDGDDATDQAVSINDPLAMPAPILDYLNGRQWGDHHLEWHTVRQWDRLRPQDQEWARGQGWRRADIQEGQVGNGLEFLAMHRVMIRTLVKEFPKDAALFAGWKAPPVSHDDADDPVPPNNNNWDFDKDKAKALDELASHLDTFKTDDEFGLYVETTLRPTAQDPNGRAADKSVGIHNYMHNRFMEPGSPIDIGDPSVNLQNRRFWRLHGWIESRWTEFRKQKGLTDSDPAYQAAIKKGEAMLTMSMRGTLNGEAAPSPPPKSLRKFFEQEK